MRRAYIHGFASSPLAKKAVRLREEFEARGEPFSIPDLNRPSFAELSVGAMLEALDALDAREGDHEGWGFVGSSLGGWLSARWAELHPDRVSRLVLLCPAFDIGARWPTLVPAGAMEKWARTGHILVDDAAGVPTPLHYAFYEEARREPAFPVVSCPTILIHGTRDERVPIDGSREYAAKHPNVELIEVDDEHNLLASLDLVVEKAISCLRS